VRGELSDEFFVSLTLIRDFKINIVYELLEIKMVNLLPDCLMPFLSFWVSGKKFTDCEAEFCRVFSLIPVKD